MDPFARRLLGRSALELPALGLGGAPFGDLVSELGEANALATIEHACALGIGYFDTAPWYGCGKSEHRIGHVLRQKPRRDILVSTKVGRVLVRPADPASYRPPMWAGGLPFEVRFDYGYDGVMRSYEDSLQRLGLNRVDLLVIHDLDLGYHGSREAVAFHLDRLDRGGGWRALSALKAAGEIKAIGAGVNDRGTIPDFVDRFDLDFFLVAMPYTLLDQAVLDDEFPRCLERGIGFIIGSVFASGILLGGARTRPTPIVPPRPRSRRGCGGSRRFAGATTRRSRRRRCSSRSPIRASPRSFPGPPPPSICARRWSFFAAASRAICGPSSRASGSSTPPRRRRNKTPE